MLGHAGGESVMIRVYKNKFTGIKRKYENDKGYVLIDDGVTLTWQRNKTSEKLIKSLPYYELTFTG